MIEFRDKIIQFIPTYSGESYPKFDEISFVIPFILILATMQTKLGSKFNILIERFLELVSGKSQDAAATKAGAQGQNVVRVSQPLAGQIHQPSQADYLDRSQLLPSNPMLSAMPTKFPPQQLQQQQPAQDFYQQPMEPMAANEGGGWGSSW